MFLTSFNATRQSIFTRSPAFTNTNMGATTSYFAPSWSGLVRRAGNEGCIDAGDHGACCRECCCPWMPARTFGFRLSQLLVKMPHVEIRILLWIQPQDLFHRPKGTR